MSGFDANLDMIGKALDTAQFRHRVIANNIANANTPGYRRKIVDFDGELSQAMAGDGKIELGVTEADDPPGHKGNNVRLEAEISALQKNSLYYKMIAQFADTRFKALRSAIEGDAV